MHGKKLAYVLLFPSLLATVVLIGYPFFNAIYMGFTNYNMAFGTSQFVGLRNYKALLTDPIFLVALKNSLIYTAIVVVGQFVIGFAVAMLLNISFPLRGVFREGSHTLVGAHCSGSSYLALDLCLSIWNSQPHSQVLGLIRSQYRLVGQTGHRTHISNYRGYLESSPFMAIMLLAGLQAPR